MSRSYRRRRFREEDDQREVQRVLASAAAAAAAYEAASSRAAQATPVSPQPPPPESEPAHAAAAAAAATTRVTDGQHAPAANASPRSKIALSLPAAATDAASAASSATPPSPTPTPPSPTPSAHSSAAASSSPPVAGVGGSVSSTPLKPSRSRRSLGGAPESERSKSGSGSRVLVEVFVQRWTAAQVTAAWERLFALLYPSYEPSTEPASVLVGQLAELLDDWTAALAAATRAVPLDDIRVTGGSEGLMAGGKFQTERVGHKRPLVVGAAALRELREQPFEMPEAAILSGSSARAQETESSGDVSAMEESAESAPEEPNSVSVNKSLVQLQKALRPLLEHVLSLHDVTDPGSALRDRLCEVLSTLVALSYGFELQLFAECLQAFKSMPSATLSPGTLQRLVSHVCDFALRFQTALSQDATAGVALNKFGLMMLRSHMALLTPALHLSIAEAALLHQSAAHSSEMHMGLLLPFAIKSMPAALKGWCACGRAGPEGATTASVPAPSAAAAATPKRSASAPASLNSIAPCVLCQREEQTRQSTSAKQIAALTFQRLIDSVAAAKASQPETQRFLRSPCGLALSGAVVRLSTTLCPTSSSSSVKSRVSRSSSSLSAPHMLCNLLLLSCKWAQGSHAADSPLQCTRRRIRGLRLMRDVLESAQGFWVSSPALLLLLRSAVFPSLLSAALFSFPLAGDVMFRLVLLVFQTLWEGFLPYCLEELALLLQRGLLPMLDGGFATLRQKQRILELLKLVLRSPLRVMSTYAACDYASKDRRILDAILATLMHLLEGDVDSFPVPPVPDQAAAASSGEGGSGGGDGADENVDPHDEDGAEITPSSVANAALRLLVHLLFMSAQWAGVPGLKRLGSVPAPLRAAQLAEEKEEWEGVLEAQRRAQQIDEQILQLARSGKIKSALRYAGEVQPCARSASAMARYLLETESLSKADVGDFLANLDDDFLSAAQYDALREAYVALLDFAGLSFDEALRAFLCDSGFRLPGEAQKIDRLLSAFCARFCADNPGRFRNAGSAFIVAFALVMLNTDLHDVRLRSGKSSRKPMTLEGFVSNLRGVDDGRDFPRAFLEKMYRAIQARPIEWKEQATQDAAAAAGEDAAAAASSSSAASAAGGKSKRKEERLTPAQRAQRRLEGSMRQAKSVHRLLLHHLSCALVSSRSSFRAPTSATLVAPLFDSLWFRALGIISILAEQTAGTTAAAEASNTTLCLDGLAYGITLAIVLEARTVCSAYLTVLAKLAYVEGARAEHRKRLLMEEVLRRQKQAPSAGLASALIASSSTATATSNSSKDGSPQPPLVRESSVSSSVAAASAVVPSLSRAAIAALFRAEIEAKIGSRQHLRQPWFKALSTAFSEDGEGDQTPDASCRAVFNICSQTKQALKQEARFVRVQQLQEEFASASVHIYAPAREMLKEGLLWKFKSAQALADATALAAVNAAAAAGAINTTSGGSPLSPSTTSSSNSTHRPVYFFLLTDLALYASAEGAGDGGGEDGAPSPYRFRRAFHLSLLEVQGAGGGDAADAAQEQVWFPFTLTSPQGKPLILAAPDASSRQQWIDAIRAQRSLLAQRQASCVSLHDLPRSKQMSHFVGGLALGLSPDLSVLPASYCLLCLRAYHAIFRRASQCAWCAVSVCSECCAKRVRLPPHMIAQCSAQSQHQAAAVAAAEAAAAASASPPALNDRSPSPADPAAAAAAAAASSGSSFFSRMNTKAQASVSSMQSKLRAAITKLNEREGVAVCDACYARVKEESSLAQDVAYDRTSGDDTDA